MLRTRFLLFEVIRGQQGVVRCWKHHSGFGFITASDGLEYFCNRRSLGGGFFLKESSTIQFDGTPSSKPGKLPFATSVFDANGGRILPLLQFGIVTEWDPVNKVGTITQQSTRGPTYDIDGLLAEVAAEEAGQISCAKINTFSP